MFGAIIGRAEAQVVRLSCVYALLDKSAEISLKHLEAALALWDYCERSAFVVFGDSTGNLVADGILKAMKEHGPLDKTQISDLFGRNRSADEIDWALTLLEREGRAIQTVESTGGRPRIVWWPYEINEKNEKSPPEGQADMP
jgi:hypothetical protein